MGGSANDNKCLDVSNRCIVLARVTHGPHVPLVKFADKRRSWQHVQLDLLYTIDRPWLILHAELSSRCPERVSTFILDFRSPVPLLPRFYSLRREVTPDNRNFKAGRICEIHLTRFSYRLMYSLRRKVPTDSSCSLIPRALDLRVPPEIRSPFFSFRQGVLERKNTRREAGGLSEIKEKASVHNCVQCLLKVDHSSRSRNDRSSPKFIAPLAVCPLEQRRFPKYEQ